MEEGRDNANRGLSTVLGMDTGREGEREQEERQRGLHPIRASALGGRGGLPRRRGCSK